MKQNLKRFHFIRLLVTLIISAAIIAAGFVFINGIQRFIPTYKNSMTYMGEDNVQIQPLYWKREEEITIYPWKLYKENTMLSLTDSDKEILIDANILSLLSQAVLLNGDADFISAFQKVTINNSTVYFLKDFECTGYQMPNNTMNEKTDLSANAKTKQDMSSLISKAKVVNCALDQYGQILYLYVADKDAIKTPVDNKQIEEAYNKFALHKNTLEEQKEYTASYLDDINNLYQLFEKNNQSMAAYVLEDFFASDSSAYDVVTQDQQILLIYTLSSGYRIIFTYNVPMRQVAGISIEKLSV